MTDSPWGAPRFPDIRPRIRELIGAFAERVVWTRFVAPARPEGAWREYYAQFPFALQPPDAPLYALVEDPGAAPVVDATTFGTWGPELAADAGIPVRVVADACAGSTDDDHERALRLMSLYAPLVRVVPTAEVLAGR